MEKVYLQHQSKKLLKQQIKASDKDSDLHKTSINIARQQVAVSIHESIQQIITEFKSSAPNCALSYDDAAVLLVKQK
jgi:cell division protein FtsL